MVELSASLDGHAQGYEITESPTTECIATNARWPCNLLRLPEERISCRCVWPTLPKFFLVLQTAHRRSVATTD